MITNVADNNVILQDDWLVVTIVVRHMISIRTLAHLIGDLVYTFVRV